MSVQAFDHAATAYGLPHAYWLAEAAKLAYQPPETVEQTAHDWGFDRVRHHETTFRPPFPLQDTQAYTAASDRMIVTAFRGTEPAQIKDWLSDTTTPPWPGPDGHGFVHYGFGEALQSIYPQVRDAITELRDNDQTIWFTGHSLGGALAALAGMRLHFEEPRLLPDGVYTFGQPRVCDRVLAKAHDEAFRDRTHRFVNNNDIVPQVPPEPAFHHVETLHYIDSGGKIREEMSTLGGVADRAKGLTADAFAPASDGVRDHLMDRYLEALKSNAFDEPKDDAPKGGVLRGNPLKSPAG
ncbi:lipase family protein [Actinosynnema sp. NPDC047251]|uniref:Lipase n=1 Tax=Saccharothrix espanaensis (strain ATCC 51144 / DSM 44229 / JCM 9112 / NBRC 15066 / NRRL 15764) TaxID=1179773 RepID=K0K5Y9_SACES|nr:lipase family protein [Saccharothrix espanaensis]CCH31973.1 Lipase [Saccharothrix espanaensis DSM 44229]